MSHPIIGRCYYPQPTLRRMPRDWQLETDDSQPLRSYSDLADRWIGVVSALALVVIVGQAVWAVI